MTLIFRSILLFLTLSSLSSQTGFASHDAGSSDSAAGSSSMSSQIHTCPGCENEIDEGDDLVRCEIGHFIHKDCLSDQVKYTKDIHDLKAHGLRCRTRLGGAQCTQKHPFDKIVKALTSAQIEEINKTLVKKDLRKIGIHDESCAICLENHKFKKEIVKLGCDCKQGYCPKCIDQWLKVQKDGTCPTCRAPFDGLTTHYLDDSLEIIDPRLTQRPALNQASVVNEEQAPAAAAAPEIAQAPQNEGVLQLVQNVQGISLEFAALGNMHVAAGFIWSGVAPRTMNWQEAINYCAALGGGARLPTADEYRALSRAMSPGVQYNSNLLPDTYGIAFWSSSLQGDYNAFYLHGSYGTVHDSPRHIAISVRCVRDGRANPQVPAQIPNVEPAPPAAAAAEIVQAPQNEGIRLVQNVQGISPAFANLGAIYEAAGLIWSKVSPQTMNWQSAKDYCANLGEGARLPTADEYRALNRAMSPGGRYTSNLFPDTGERWFWSSSPDGENFAFFFYGPYGNVDSYIRNSPGSVRCVQDRRVNPQVPADVPNVVPAPVAAAHDIVQAPQNEGVPQLMRDVQRVDPEFAALGNMHEAAGLIWSWVAPRLMNWQDAINYCAALGGGARLPTVDEYRALSRAMSPGGRFNPNLLPNTQRNAFWSSSPHGDSFAFWFSGSSGYVHHRYRISSFSVRCVSDGRVNPQVHADIPNVAPAPAAAPEVVQAPQNEGVFQLMRDVQRVNPEFAALGNMYEAAGLIWSGVAPQHMNWQDAINYCAGLGGGARLPTKDECEALSLAMSPGGQYNANLLPDTRQKWFWSSSPFGADNGFFFYGSSGYVGYNSRSDAGGSVRCVRAAVN